MTPRERRWIWAFSAFLALITTLPYLVAAFASGPDHAFSGFLIGVYDGNSYIAKMLSGSQGAWLFKTPYTTYPQRGALAFLPYLLLGKLVPGGNHTGLVLLYHVFRLAAIPFAVWATYDFTAYFVEPTSWRRWITFLATLGGGLGWIALAIGGPLLSSSLPLAFISPETFGFLSFYSLPHLVVARGLLLMGLLDYARSFSQAKLAWRAGIWLGLLIFVQPLSLVPAGAVLGAMALAAAGAGLPARNWALLRKVIGRGLAALAIPIPLMLGLLLSYLTDPFVRIWASQNLILSPPAVYYLLAYGLVLVPAFWGARRLLGHGFSPDLLPLLWVLLVPVLAYAPLVVQRRLAEGSWVAWLVLAAIGLQSLGVRWRRSARIAILALSLPASFLIVAGGVTTATSLSAPAFLPVHETEVFAWLAQHAEPNSVVLAAIPVANAAPAWAPVRVVVGHGPESALFHKRASQVDAFFGDALTPAERMTLLSDLGVDYIIVGPDERGSSGWMAASLSPAYTAGGFSVWRAASQGAAQ